MEGYCFASATLLRVFAKAVKEPIHQKREERFGSKRQKVES